MYPPETKKKEAEKDLQMPNNAFQTICGID